jgi:hypothetical protein
MALFRRSVVFGKFSRSNLDLGMRLDCLDNPLVAKAALTQGFHFIADHADEGLQRKHLRLEPSQFPQRALRLKRFLDRIQFSTPMLAHRESSLGSSAAGSIYFVVRTK